MPPNFDQEGLDAYLDCKEQVYVVLAAYDRYQAAEEASVESVETTERQLEEELNVLRGLCITAAEHGIPDEQLRATVVEHFPSDLLTKLFTTT